MSQFSRILNCYLKISKCYPYTLQMIQTAILMGSGDIIAQRLIERGPEHDWLRTKQFAAIGALFVAPSTTTWYRILDKMYCKSNKSPNNIRIIGLKKMITDQIFFAPIFLGSFLLMIGRLKCKKWERNFEDVRSQYKDVMLTNYSIWPFVQLVNFTFVPLHLQVLIVQVVSLFWSSYLSFRTSKVDETGAVFEIPDDEKIESFWCKPKIRKEVVPPPKKECKKKPEDVPVAPKEEVKKEPDPIVPPPADEGKDFECLPDEDDSKNKKPDITSPSNMFFLLQAAMLLSIIFLTLDRDEAVRTAKFR